MYDGFKTLHSYIKVAFAERLPFWVVIEYSRSPNDNPKSKLRRNEHFYSGMEGKEVVSHAKGRLISQKAFPF